MNDVFIKIHDELIWKSTETPSGTGSELRSTVNIRYWIPVLFQKYNIKRVIDVGCGDCNWIKELFNGFDLYYGIDVVQAIIDNNVEKYADGRKLFFCGEISALKINGKDFDVVILSDVLVHLSYDNIFTILSKLKRSGVTYLLTTNFIETEENRDIVTGDWRRLNFERWPFNFPIPIEVIDHSDEGESAKGKVLALWNLKDIKL